MRYKLFLHQSVLALLSSIIFGCATFSRATDENAAHVKLGQSIVEVENLIGLPGKIESGLHSTSEVWHYTIYAQRGRRSYPYRATFENGKLTRWEFDTNAATEDSNLYEQRSKASKEGGSIPFAQPNGSPAINN